MAKDIVHIFLWAEFFLIGGVLGYAAGLTFILAMTPILILFGLITKNFFLTYISRKKIKIG